MWLTREHFDRKKLAFSKLTPEQKQNLTWEEARAYVPTDTLYMARWGGLQKHSGLSPYEALKKLWCDQLEKEE